MSEFVSEQVFAHLEANKATLPPILYPNLEETPPDGTHLRPFVIPASTDNVGIASDTTQDLGFIQISVYCKPGIGAIIPLQIASAVRALFPRFLNLNGVRIDQTGTISNAFSDGTWYIVPVSIPYQLIN